MITYTSIKYLQRKSRFTYRRVEQLVARRAHNPEVVGSNPSPATISGGCNGFQLHPPVSILLFVFTCVSFARRNLSADMGSLLYSFLGFVLSMLSYMGGCGMNAIVVVVVGSNMVGTNNMRGKTQQRTIRW